MNQKKIDCKDISKEYENESFINDGFVDFTDDFTSSVFALSKKEREEIENALELKDLEKKIKETKVFNDLSKLLSDMKNDSNSDIRYVLLLLLLSDINSYQDELETISTHLLDFLHNDSSLVNRFKLLILLEKNLDIVPDDFYEEHTDYGWDELLIYEIPALFNSIIAAYRNDLLSNDDYDMISKLSLYLWEIICDVSFTGEMDSKIDSELPLVMRFYGYLHIAEAYPIVRFHSQAYSKEDRAEYYWEDDYYYELRFEAIKVLINFECDDAYKVLASRLYLEPDVTIRSYIFSNSSILDKESAIKLLNEVLFCIGYDDYCDNEYYFILKYNLTNYTFKKDLLLFFQALASNNIKYQINRNDNSNYEATIRHLADLNDEDIPILLEIMSQNPDPKIRYFATIALKIIAPKDEKHLEEIATLFKIEKEKEIKEVLKEILE